MVRELERERQQSDFLGTVPATNPVCTCSPEFSPCSQVSALIGEGSLFSIICVALESFVRAIYTYKKKSDSRRDSRNQTYKKVNLNCDISEFLLESGFPTTWRIHMKNKTHRYPRRFPIWQITFPLCVVLIFGIGALTAFYMVEGRYVFDLDLNRERLKLRTDVDKREEDNTKDRPEKNKQNSAGIERRQE